jgi:hypothetical protein
MKRRIATDPLADHQRCAFLREYEKEALAVLDQVDHQICHSPEKGTTAPTDRNFITQCIHVAIHDWIFVCHIGYIYTQDAVLIKYFKAQRKAAV